MGWFDWYQPIEDLRCPICKVALKEWQGKDGQCALAIWRQGHSAPVGQMVDDEVKMPQEIIDTWRLPETFEIYSYDCGKHCVIAEGRIEGEIWALTKIISVNITL